MIEQVDVKARNDARLEYIGYIVKTFRARLLFMTNMLNYSLPRHGILHECLSVARGGFVSDCGRKYGNKLGLSCAKLSSSLAS